MPPINWKKIVIVTNEQKKNHPKHVWRIPIECMLISATPNTSLASDIWRYRSRRTDYNFKMLFVLIAFNWPFNFIEENKFRTPRRCLACVMACVVYCTRTFVYTIESMIRIERERRIEWNWVKNICCAARICLAGVSHLVSFTEYQKPEFTSNCLTTCKPRLSSHSLLFSFFFFIIRVQINDGLSLWWLSVILFVWLSVTVNVDHRITFSG